MALGAVEVSPLEMAQAYDAFSNGGYRAHAYGIERIRTGAGKVLYDHGVEQAQKLSVIGQPSLAEMNEMLRQVIASGTGAKAKIPGFDLAGKTGTTSDYRDAWFVGYTGGFVAAVWLGRDDNTPMKRVTGGGAPAEVWRDFMASALPKLQAQAIPGGVLAPSAGDAIDNLLSGANAAEPTPEAPDLPETPKPDRPKSETGPLFVAPPSPRATPRPASPSF